MLTLMHASPNARSNPKKQTSVSLTGLIGASAFLAVLSTLLGFGGRFHWALELFTHFRVQYALGLAVCACWFWLVKKRPIALCCVGFMFLNVLIVAPFFIPLRTVESPADAKRLRVLFINLLGDNKTPEKVMDYLRTTDADLVFLAELQHHWLPSFEHLRTDFPFQMHEPRYDNFGMGVLARKTPAHCAALWAPFDAPNDSIPYLEVEWLEGNHRASILAVHPPPPKGRLYAHLRNQHFAAYAQWATDQDGPALIIGDFNATPISPQYKIMAKTGGLRDSLLGHGFSWRVTWPVQLPILGIPIDNALFKGAWSPVLRTLGPHIGSDHYPLRVDMAWAAE